MPTTVQEHWSPKNRIWAKGWAVRRPLVVQGHHELWALARRALHHRALWSEAGGQPFPLRVKDTGGVTALRAPVRAGRTEFPRIQRWPPLLSFHNRQQPSSALLFPKMPGQGKAVGVQGSPERQPHTPGLLECLPLSTAGRGPFKHVGPGITGDTSFSFFPTLATGLKSSLMGLGRDTDCLSTPGGDLAWMTKYHGWWREVQLQIYPLLVWPLLGFLSCEMGKKTNSISNLPVHAWYFTSLFHSMAKMTLEVGMIIIPYYFTGQELEEAWKG